MKRRTLSSVILFLVLLGLLVSVSQPVAAQEPQPTPSDNEVNRVAKDMYCPVCENIPLDVCPTQACHEWRELIRLRLSEGWTDQEIRDYFVLHYGDRVLSEPPRRGWNWMVYILPWVFLGVGAVVLWRVMKSMRPSQVASEEPAEPMVDPDSEDDPYLRQIEEELRKKE
jgi:cytochrome c-type biogenesis protein CcmH